MMEIAVRNSESEAALEKEWFLVSSSNQKFALRPIRSAGELLVRDTRGPLVHAV
jgi:hypothetical protein